MYRTIFTIDCFIPAYIGYTSGRLWNGWGTPFFEIAEALQVMADYNKNTDRPMQYDEETDSFRVAETEYTDEEVWKGKNYNTEDGIKHLYGIGAYCWIWDAVNVDTLPSKLTSSSMNTTPTTIGTARTPLESRL